MHTLLVRLDAVRRFAPVAFLLLLLQRTPVLPLLLRSGQGAPAAVVTLLRTALLAAAGGLTHTLTGATTFATTPKSPASAPAGTAFSMAFSVTGAPSTPKSYKIAGTLPPGLAVTGINGSGVVNASTGSITGTPTTAGGYTFTIQAWEFTNATGEKSPLYSVTINVTGAAATAPSITTQPAGTSVTVGGSASFSVTASGTAPLAYQWRKDGANLAGATSVSLSLSNVQTSDAGSYSVVVSNAAGSVTSSSATLSVSAAATAPSITTQPAGTSVTVGGSASFSVTASGTAPLAYQWRKDGANLAGATSASLALSNVQTSDAGSYSVVVSNAAGSVTSSSATLSVSAAATAPSITTQPAGTSATVGGSASFSVTASGTAPLAYQWRKDGANLAGATSASLSLSNVQTSDAGSYSVVVSNAAGSVTSSGATLSVSAAAGTAPGIVTAPAELHLPAGYPGSMTVVASGAAPLSYQWFRNGAAIAGATAATYSIASAQTSLAGNITVSVTNASGSVTTPAVPLVVGTNSGRLAALSVRAWVGNGANVLIPGIAVNSSAPKTVLIRAVGPGLIPYGVPPGEVLADPQITVFSGGTVVAANDNWESATNVATLPAVFAATGNFSLPAGSKDAVLLVALPAGTYTAVISGVGGGTGIALVEVYEVN